MRKKVSISFWIKLLLVQIVILALFFAMFYECRPISSDTKPITITVEEVKYERTVLGRDSSHILILYANSKGYIFSGKQNSSTEDYSTSRLYDTIQAGDSITLICQRKISFDGILNQAHYVIAHANTDTEIYRSLDNFNAEMKSDRIVAIVVFSIIEGLFLLVGGFCIWLHLLDRSHTNKRKKHKVKGTRQENTSQN